MSHFNYLPNTPYSNPAGEIEKQTNELPKEVKTQTTARKRRASTRPRAKKVTKAEENK